MSFWATSGRMSLGQGMSAGSNITIPPPANGTVAIPFGAGMICEFTSTMAWAKHRKVKFDTAIRTGNGCLLYAHAGGWDELNLRASTVLTGGQSFQIVIPANLQAEGDTVHREDAAAH